MTDQPPPNEPQEYVMDLVTQEERVPTSRPPTTRWARRIR